jgi:hypothetical protein
MVSLVGKAGTGGFPEKIIEFGTGFYVLDLSATAPFPGSVK